MYDIFYFNAFVALKTSRNSKSTTKRAAKSYERPGLSEEEIEEIREAFNLFDTDGSGKFCQMFTFRTIFIFFKVRLIQRN